MVREVAPIVTEEWGHFRMVLAELDKRNLPLGKQRKDMYVQHLLAFQNKTGDRNIRLIEMLLTCALIEVRSCERFRLLSLEINEISLRKFYHQFMVSEAGHYKLFLSLAKLYENEEMVSKRWHEYLTFEADMIKKLPIRADRMH